MEIPFEVIATARDVDAGAPLLDILDSFVGWRETPPFERTGRCAHVRLPEPCGTIRSVKLKGIGARTHEGEIIQPTTEALNNPNPHVGFAPNGKVLSIVSPPAPVGGITVPRALQELRNADLLLRSGCPTVVPLRVYRYTDPRLRFSPAPGERPVSLGVVATGFPIEAATRADAIYFYATADENDNAELRRWGTSIGVRPTADLFTHAASLLDVVSAGFGHALRRFTEAGLYRYSGAPDNYTYDPATGDVLLIDLDSSLPLAGLSPIEKPLQMMRDAASGVAYQIACLTHPRALASWPADLVADTNPFATLLAGYYGEIDRSHIARLCEPIVDYYVSVRTRSAAIHPAGSAHPAMSFREHLEHSFLRPWVNRAESFRHVLAVAAQLHGHAFARATYAT